MAEFIRGANGEMQFVPSEPVPTEPTAAQTSGPVPVVDTSKFKWVEDESSPIIDRVTGKRIRVDEKDLNGLILNGRVGYSKERDVNVVDSDGNTFAVKGEYLKHALSQGARVETATERGVKQYVAENKGIGGAFKAGLQNYADELLFGIPDVVDDHTLTDFEKAKKQALKDDHNVANAIGGVAGFVGNLVATEGFAAAAKGTQLGIKGVQIAGKASEIANAAEKVVQAERAVDGVEKLGAAARITQGLVAKGIAKEEAVKISESIVSKIAKGAFKEGVNGALYTAPRAVTEAALGDPDTAAESLLIGFGAGAALGGFGAAAKEGIGAIRGVAGKATESLAEKQAFKSLILSSDQAVVKRAEALPGGQTAIGRMLLDDGLLRKPGSEDWAGYAERLAGARNEAGKTLEKTYQKLDAFGAHQFDPEDIARKLKAEVIDPLASKLGKTREIAKVEAVGKEFLQKFGTEYENGFASKVRKIGFEELWNTRKELDDMIYKEGQIAVTDPVKKELQKFRGILENEIEHGINKIEKSGIADAGALDAYKADKLKFRRMIVAADAAEKSAIKHASNATLSLTDHTPMLAAGTALFTGHPVGAAMGLASVPFKKAIREDGNIWAATILDKLGVNGKTAGSILAAGGAHSQSGVLMAEKAMADVGYKLDTIPGIINTMGMVGKRAVVRKAIDKDTLQAINDLLADPKGMQKNIDQLSGIVGDAGAPTVAKLYAQKQLSALNYIKENAPSQPLHDPYKRVQGDASVIEKAKFTRKLEVLGNPYSVLDHLEKGTLTREHVEALNANYPKLKDAIVQKIIEHENSGKMAPVGSQYRAQIELLKGNATNNNVQFFQDMHAASAKSAKGKKMGAGQLKLTASPHMTDMDRINYKGIGRK